MPLSILMSYAPVLITLQGGPAGLAEAAGPEAAAVAPAPNGVLGASVAKINIISRKFDSGVGGRWRAF